MHRSVATTVASAVLIFAAVDALAALPQRTFVSVSGNDANTAFNCSLAAPCRSFGSAMSVTSAGGEIIVLDSGGYGTVTVDRSIAIISPAGVYAGISVGAGADGVDIATASIDVVLRGLTINGRGGTNGVSFTAGNSLEIEDCVIATMNNIGVDASAPTAGVRIKDTTIRNNSGLGVSAHGNLAYLGLDHVRIEGGSSPGIHVADGPKAVVANSFVERNNTGIFVIPTTGTSASLTLIDTVIAHNGGDGIYTFASGASTHANVSMFGGTITGEGTTGVRADSSTGATVYVAISNASITDNGSDGIQVTSGGANTRVSVGGSTISRNGGFGLHNGTGTLLSRQDNTVHDNNGGGVQTSGTITPLAGI